MIYLYTSKYLDFSPKYEINSLVIVHKVYSYDTLADLGNKDG